MHFEPDMADSRNIIYLGNQMGIYVHFHNGTDDLTLSENIGWAFGFLQTSCTEILVAATNANCLMKINRTTSMVSEFSGTCKGENSELSQPADIAIDRMNHSQYLVTENKALKAVDVETGNVTMFAQPSMTNIMFLGMAQTENGDIYIHEAKTIFKAGYFNREVRLIAGSIGMEGFIDGGLADSRFGSLWDIEFITPHAFLVTDLNNHVLRLVDTYEGKVSTIDFCSTSCNPVSLRKTNNSLYIGGQANAIYIIHCE